MKRDTLYRPRHHESKLLVVNNISLLEFGVLGFELGFNGMSKCFGNVATEMMHMTSKVDYND